VRRGEEKGRFEFGGSTVILLLQEERVRPAQALLDATADGWETEVRCGEQIGVGS
ncbi:MAG: phosphatidylserine decarboxylase, partial [Candidatus Onthomonas sp.]|nr:phosphatidylserine decarboxylase [Candidatus Onthomonas sp.]